MFQILVAEDDRHTARLMRLILTHAGYSVLSAENGQEALTLLDQYHVDLVVLDVMMPVMDGNEFARQIRADGSTLPILMVTAKQLPKERCQGFLSGADDYMVKPVDEEEMLLRIKALLRRSRIATEHKLCLGSVVLDYDALSVRRGSEEYPLPPKEFYLLYKLLSYPNRIFTRRQLMDEIWGMDSQTVDTTVNVHITRLRRKFGDWKEFELCAIRGIGYKAVIHHENF